ncbi:heavy metal translocating P-type ATPase [Cyanobium sp. Candia 9D4]|uniref:heavy metal translocating P-type ATPase n=1 Tax=unclassified Cyanobium TaxID=2627006 RepID=UPI0020CD2E57|nr:MULTISPECIES: heavy metal translocating P-type ATPase [unclassified Cyanobium]MCP9837373.1 heavy metal translocating P-type ATPase [Cyanobium sp. N.Huapi 1H5]MCP9934105.1 heavy metal translocating P-type ATPase [Cyanobium sp. Candia 9D4]
MDCATEETEIRHALAGVDGIHGLRFLLAERVLAIDAEAAALNSALAAIRRLGFNPEPISSDHRPSAAQTRAERRLERLRLAGSLALALTAELLHLVVPAYPGDELVEIGIAITAIALAGFSVFRKGLAALRQGRLNINALMSVAVTGAFLIGRFPEAAMVMALYAVAEAIEARAVERARQAITSLMALAPDEAEIRQSDGRWQRVAAIAVAIGDVVRVRPGERLPLDGTVLSGESAIDQAPITGESLPVDKGPGDEVFAGTINQGGALEILVTAPASLSTLARIIQAVEEAQASRAPIQRFVDRFAARYTPAVFVVALAIALLAPPVLGFTPMQAIYKALVLLVIACPCALVIATPVTVVSGLATAARRGIIIKGGLYIEEARKIKALALDKTGTITLGKPKLVAFSPQQEGADADALKQWASSLAERSDHPVSRAVATGLDGERLAVEAFEALPGRGVRGVVAGRPLMLANHRWIEELGLCSSELEASMQVHERQGRSLSLLADDSGVLALIAVADTVRPSSAAAMEALRALGVTPVMLTGDNAATASAIAALAGIEQVKSNLLPQEKLEAVADLQARYGFAAMAGDGINDAPALAQADIGFAMGAAGTHIAIEAADVVIMNDDLMRVPETIALSRRTFTILRQNIALALGIKALFLVLTVAGNATMWMAVFADMGTSLIVIANGLRLLRRPNLLTLRG